MKVRDGATLPVLHTIETAEWEQAEVYGYKKEFFSDPGRDFEPFHHPQDWLVTAYLYFGGVEVWKNLPGSPSTVKPAPSPVQINDMRGDWALVGCTIIKANGEWGGDNAAGAYENTPSHGLGGKGDPQGGDQVFADLSGRWVQFSEMLPLHSHANQNSRAFYWHQVDLGGYQP